MRTIDAAKADLEKGKRLASKLLESGTAGSGQSPLAEARLRKTLKEIERLEITIQNLRLEQRVLSGDLLRHDEAVALVSAVQQGIANSLRGWPKTMAPRLYNQPQRAIEATLADAVALVLAGARDAVAKVEGRSKL